MDDEVPNRSTLKTHLATRRFKPRMRGALWSCLTDPDASYRTIAEFNGVDFAELFRAGV